MIRFFAATSRRAQPFLREQGIIGYKPLATQQCYFFSTNRQAKKGDLVHIKLTVLDHTNTELFSEPVSFVLGKGDTIVGLERKLLETKEGEKWTETFGPEEAFGIHDPSKLFKVPKPKGGFENDIQVGSAVQLDTGMTAKVVQVEEDVVIVDTNHPLVGRTVTFKVELEKIEEEEDKEQHNNTIGEVQIDVIKAGDGKTYPKAGSRVSVHYVGTLTENGKEFDSSRKRSQPFSFTLGQGLVIQGWEIGIAKLSLGQRAKLFIPSSLGYGKRGAGGVIPPDADLCFDVELLQIDSHKAPSSS